MKVAEGNIAEIIKSEIDGVSVFDCSIQKLGRAYLGTIAVLHILVKHVPTRKRNLLLLEYSRTPFLRRTTVAILQSTASMARHDLGTGIRTPNKRRYGFLAGRKASRKIRGDRLGIKTSLQLSAPV